VGILRSTRQAAAAGRATRPVRSAMPGRHGTTQSATGTREPATARHTGLRWLPNAISVLRVLLVPCWVLLAEHTLTLAAAGLEYLAARTATLGVLLLIGFSDLFDGWLARRWHVGSRLGAVLDAVADKLCQLVLVTWLSLRLAADSTVFSPLPLWLLLLVVLRDAILLVCLLVARRIAPGIDVEHDRHGKWASLLLFSVLAMACVGARHTWLGPAVWLTAGFVALSTTAYLRRGVLQLRGMERRGAVAARRTAD
jgi:cardiolipin synthase